MWLRTSWWEGHNLLGWTVSCSIWFSWQLHFQDLFPSLFAQLQMLAKAPILQQMRHEESTITNSLISLWYPHLCLLFQGSRWSSGEESTCQCRRFRFVPSVTKSPEVGNDNPLLYSCLENPHGQRSLEGYSPWNCKELDTTEHKHTTCTLYRSLQIMNSQYSTVLDSTLPKISSIIFSHCIFRNTFF